MNRLLPALVIFGMITLAHPACAKEGDHPFPCTDAAETVGQCLMRDISNTNFSAMAGLSQKEYTPAETVVYMGGKIAKYGSAASMADYAANYAAYPAKNAVIANALRMGAATDDAQALAILQGIGADALKNHRPSLRSQQWVITMLEGESKPDSAAAFAKAIGYTKADLTPPKEEDASWREGEITGWALAGENAKVMEFISKADQHLAFFSLRMVMQALVGKDSTNLDLAKSLWPYFLKFCVDKQPVTLSEDLSDQSYIACIDRLLPP